MVAGLQALLAIRGAWGKCTTEELELGFLEREHPPSPHSCDTNQIGNPLGDGITTDANLMLGISRSMREGP